MSVERSGLTVVLFATSCTLSGQALAQSKDQVTISKPSFELRASPGNVVVHRNQPISVTVDLTNVTGRDAFVRLWTWPTPFGPHTDLHCLMLQCRAQFTGKEVSYKWPPPGKTVEDGEVSPHLPAVMEALREQGCSVEVRPVSYEFQRGGNKMLVVQYTDTSKGQIR